MLKIHPNFWSILFSPSCKSYALILEDYFISWDDGHQKKSFSYRDISELSVGNGLFWKTLVIHSSDGHIHRFGGLTENKIRSIKEKFQDRVRFIENATKSFENVLPLLIELHTWVEGARSGYFWISESDLIEKRSLAKKLTEFFTIPPDVDEVFKANKDKLKSIQEFYEIGREVIDYWNESFTNLEIDKFSDLLNKVEKNSLTLEQSKAVVCDEDATLVVASAGSGKTSLLVGKVGYLLKKKLARPDQITILSFNRKAKEEIAERIHSRLSVECNTHTFHSLGLNLLANLSQKKSSLVGFVQEESDRGYKEFINSLVGDIFNSKNHSENIREFFVSHAKPYKDQFSFKDQGDYFKYLKSSEILTLKGERVRSFEELEIANYLYVNGVNYKYEQQYEFDTATIKYRQYKPDFFIVDYGIYLEHFAINRNGKTPPFIDEDEYLAGIEWKRNIHQLNKTSLLETYSYQKKEGTLTELLGVKLQELGVIFNPIPSEQLFEVLNSKGYVSEFSNLCATFLNLFKGRGASVNELKAGLDEGDPNVKRFLSFLDIFADIYDRYQEHLIESKEIDFHDMINLAAEAITSGALSFDCKYLLVDEFQDISPGRSKLINAIKNANPKLKIFCVGDDWQSIYRFTGSDINLMTRFEEYFGYTKRYHLTQTFRFNNRIENVASKFIQKNPSQIKKDVVTISRSMQPEVVAFLPNKGMGRFMDMIVQEISKLAGGSAASVLVLGRYNFINDGIEYSSFKSMAPNLSFEFNTVHRSKGREADYVIVLGMNSGKLGFPTEIVDDPIINFVLSRGENFPHAEERRLFYVALTRAKHRVYVVGDSFNTSSFFTELVTDAYDVEKRGVDLTFNRHCPACSTGRILEKTGSKGLFLGCENYPMCEFTTDMCKSCGTGFLEKKGELFICDNPECKHQVRACPQCGDGMLLEKSGQYGPFLGCSNYSRKSCTYTGKIPPTFVDKCEFPF